MTYLRGFYCRRFSRGNEVFDCAYLRKVNFDGAESVEPQCFTLETDRARITDAEKQRKVGEQEQETVE